MQVEKRHRRPQYGSTSALLKYVLEQLLLSPLLDDEEQEQARASSFLPCANVTNRKRHLALCSQ